MSKRSGIDNHDLLSQFEDLLNSDSEPKPYVSPESKKIKDLLRLENYDKVILTMGPGSGKSYLLNNSSLKKKKIRLGI